MRRMVTTIGTAVGAALLVGGAWYYNVAAKGRAVAADARRRGLSPDSLLYPAHWPLDYYEPRLRHASSPEAAEVLVPDADSVGYYLFEVAGTGADSALVQAFFFRLDSYKGVVQTTYGPAGRIEVDGSDWIPDATRRVTKERAFRWYRDQSARQSPNDR